MPEGGGGGEQPPGLAAEVFTLASAAGRGLRVLRDPCCQTAWEGEAWGQRTGRRLHGKPQTRFSRPGTVSHG